MIYIDDPETRSDDWIKDVPGAVDKHLGPGNHPNGSPQTVHGGGGGGSPQQSSPWDPNVVTRDEMRARLDKAFGETTMLEALSHLSVAQTTGYTAPTLRTLQNLAKVYNNPTLTDRFGTTISDIKVMDDGSIELEGHILDWNNDGEVAGNYSRTFQRDTVHHDYLGIRGDWQGLGIGKALTDAAEAAYIDSGFRKINVEAGLAVGGYAWARAGYGFRGPVPTGDGASDHPLSRVKRANNMFAGGSSIGGFNRAYRRGDSGDIEVMMEGRNWVKAADGAAWDALSVKVGRGHATPQDIAVIGQDVFTYPSGGTGGTRWLGKDILMGSNWWGVKHLNPATDAPVAKSWLDEEFPRRADGETEAAYLARLAATAPADLFDGEPPTDTTDVLDPFNIAKHYGPGAHRNGTPQSVHSGKGGAGGSYMKTAEGRRRLAAAFPQATIHIDEAYPMEPEAFHGMVRGLEDMAEKFPKVAAEVVLIRTGTDIDGSDAQTDWTTTRGRDGKMISGIGFIFNPAEINREGLITVKTQEYLNGETFTVTPTDSLGAYARGVAVHEFGHAVHNLALSKVTGAPLFEDGEYGVPVKNDDLWMEGFGYDRRMSPVDAAYMYGATNYPGTEAETWGLALDEIRMPMAPKYPPGDFNATHARTMSEYATTNRAEQVAEGFALRHGPATGAERIPPELNAVLDEMESAVR